MREFSSNFEQPEKEVSSETRREIPQSTLDKVKALFADDYKDSSGVEGDCCDGNENNNEADNGEGDEGKELEYDEDGTRELTDGEKQELKDNDVTDDEVIESDDNNESQEDSGEKKGLTDEEKQKIKEMTGWSDEIIDAIGSMKEAKIYMDAKLQEAEIDGKKCLIKSDINLDQKDGDGISNRERMKRGRPPINKDGQEVELHHIGQKPDSPLAELTTQEHRGVGNDTVLHDKNKESEIDRNEFAKDRKNHWKSRAEEGGA